jgi:proteasome lid subunit RPN8/RPN11
VRGLTVPANVLDEVRRHLEDAGAAGVEATGYLVAGPDGVARHAIFPDQVAGRSPACWVAVTDRGRAELALALGDDETYVARVHSHPGAAYHSTTDDRNPALRHEGALSIVVPYFGLGLRTNTLRRCAVFVRRARHWVELAPGPGRDEVLRVAD